MAANGRASERHCPPAAVCGGAGAPVGQRPKPARRLMPAPPSASAGVEASRRSGRQMTRRSRPSGAPTTAAGLSLCLSRRLSFLLPAAFLGRFSSIFSRQSGQNATDLGRFPKRWKTSEKEGVVERAVPIRLKKKSPAPSLSPRKNLRSLTGRETFCACAPAPRPSLVTTPSEPT